MITGNYYSFYVVAVDFNDVSEESEESVFVVCLTPTHIDSPYFISADQTSITMGWTKPGYLGGCPLLTYKLHMREPGEQHFSVVDESLIANRPYLV